MGNILHSTQNNQKIFSPESESKIFAQFKYLTSTTPLELKARLRISILSLIKIYTLDVLIFINERLLYSVDGKYYTLPKTTKKFAN